MPLPHLRGPARNSALSPASENTDARTLTLKQVVELTSLSKAYVYKLIALGLFPAPAKVGRKSMWLAREVSAWVEARFAERSPASDRMKRNPRGGDQ
jgi:prophage regulatory protein